MLSNTALQALSSKVKSEFDALKSVEKTQKKRLRDGKPKEPLKPSKKEDTKPLSKGFRGELPNPKVKPVPKDGLSAQKDRIKKSSCTKSPKSILLREILSLGGTEEDLELLEGIESNEDISEDTSKTTHSLDRKLRKELKAFMGQNGIVVKKFEDEVFNAEVEEDASDWGTDDNSSQPVNKMQEEVSSTRLILEPQSLWYQVEMPGIEEPGKPLVSRDIEKQIEEAKTLLRHENGLYATLDHVSTSDRQFLGSILKSGTLNDRVSALTLVIQQSPIHSVRYLENLFAMTKKKSRNEALQAIGALQDLFTTCVLPNRKLKYIKQQVGIGHSGINKKTMLLWAFEDFLKTFYFEYLQEIEKLLHDPLPFVRSQALNYVFVLLRDRPEQEQNLLRLLVNKLGDSDRKVAAKASYNLLQLQHAHPAMKKIVIGEIENTLHRANCTYHVQYYSMITLNQTILTSKDTEVANNLIEVYFNFFTQLLQTSTQEIKSEEPRCKINQKTKNKSRPGKEKESMDSVEATNSKLISAVLTGINRAFPFSQMEDQVFLSHVDNLFRFTHSSNFNVSIQALLLIHHISTKKELVTDRFYRTLYESLLDLRLIESTKQAMYMNLLFSALKSDFNMRRVRSFVKRMLQIASLQKPPFISGLLYLLGELMSVIPSLRNMITQPEDLGDEENFQDINEDDDLKSENNNNPLHVKYDGRKRDPLYSGAENTCLWELLPFLTHFHPTISLYALQILRGEKITTKPDLALHSLNHFLDRFVYRNPKTKSSQNGKSIMQPLPSGDSRNIIVSTKDTAAAEDSVNSAKFWNMNSEQVPVDSVFFHKYFQLRRCTKQSHLETTAHESDSEEDQVWKALVGSNQEDDSSTDNELETDSGDSFGESSQSQEEELQQKAQDIDNSRKGKRRKLKHLPLFASVEEYASLLD